MSIRYAKKTLYIATTALFSILILIVIYSSNNFETDQKSEEFLVTDRGSSVKSLESLSPVFRAENDSYSKKINYFIDTIRGKIISLYAEFSGEENKFSIIDPAEYKKYITTYNNLPDKFIHFGNFLFYKAVKGEKIKDIALKSIKYTHFYKLYKLRKAVQDYNGFGDVIDRNTIVYIPYSLPSYQPEIRKREKAAIIYSRGLYFTGRSVGSEKIFRKLERFKNVGVNTVVFDAKDVSGIVEYFSHVPDVQEYDTHRKRNIDDIDKLIRALRAEGIYSIARLAVFRDHLLCRKNRDFCIRSARTGGRWNADSKELWCDPTNKQVQDYNISLAIELAEKGVDEIQFDYIRFPTRGDRKDAVHAYHFGRMSRDAVITHFLKRAYNEISKRNTRVSIDIFGIVAWGKKVDINRTGQRIESLSRYCDVISPMLYPSHFNDDFDGFAKPGDNPYYFIYKGCKNTDKLAGGVVIRPWLQAFGWRVKSYDEEYILKQIIGSREGNAFGYLFWNSSGNYETVYRALKKMTILNKK